MPIRMCKRWNADSNVQTMECQFECANDGMPIQMRKRWNANSNVQTMECRFKCANKWNVDSQNNDRILLHVLRTEHCFTCLEWNATSHFIMERHFTFHNGMPLHISEWNATSHFRMECHFTFQNGMPLLHMLRIDCYFTRHLTTSTASFVVKNTILQMKNSPSCSKHGQKID